MPTEEDTENPYLVDKNSSTAADKQTVEKRKKIYNAQAHLNFAAKLMLIYSSIFLVLKLYDMTGMSERLAKFDDHRKILVLPIGFHKGGQEYDAER